MSTTSRRATSNHETRKNPKYFPNYFKTVENSRVSSKDPKDGKMCSSKNPTFESYWTYVKKTTRGVKQAEEGECQMSKSQCQTKAESGGQGMFKIKGSMFKDLIPDIRSLAAQHRIMKQARIRNFSRSTLKPFKSSGFRSKF
jgi:hypothetical protein